MSERYDIGSRNTLRQLREKARYDRKTVHDILDRACVAHVGFSGQDGPVVIPMMYGRRDETVFLHGARKARIVRLLEQTTRACLSVTLLDGLVVARSAFNSSMNYRAVVVHGTARLIDDPDAHLEALRVITDHALPGRWAELRAPLRKERLMTGVIAVQIDAASAKVSHGDPDDEEADYALDTWAGVVPLETRFGEPRPDPVLREGIETPASVRAITGRRL